MNLTPLWNYIQNRLLKVVRDGACLVLLTHISSYTIVTFKVNLCCTLHYIPVKFMWAEHAKSSVQIWANQTVTGIVSNVSPSLIHPASFLLVKPYHLGCSRSHHPSLSGSLIMPCISGVMIKGLPAPSKTLMTLVYFYFLRK